VSLSDDLAAEVGDPKSKPGPKKANGTNYAGDSMFDAVNLTPIVSVLDWLAIEHDDKRVKCPHCGNGFPCDTSCAIVGNAVKCSHDACSGAGPNGFAGLRTGVDLTMLVHRVEKIEAVKMMAAQFCIDLPRKATASNDTEGARQPLWEGGPAEEHVKQVAASPKRKRLSVEDIVNEWREAGAVEHVDIGIHTLDRACRGGMAIPRRVLLVGAPSAGKTFVEIVIADRFLTVLRDYGFIVGIVAVDEYTGDVLARFAQMNGFTREQIEARQPATLDEIESKLSNAALGFYDADWTLDEVIADLAEWSKATGKKVVLFVDSMHTARCDASETARSPKELVEMNLRLLKTANLQHKFTIIATAEMNRFGYSNQENADKANKMSLAAEARAFEYWAELMIVLQSMNDFPDTTHGIIAKNRGGSKDVHFWLRLDHERHTFDEVGDPNANPELVAKVEESKKSATNAKVVRDANDLAKFMIRHPSLGTEQLRIQVSIEPSMGWGVGRTVKALAALKAGLTDY